MPRFQVLPLVTTAIAAASLAFLAAHAGPLSPPAGPVASSFKTLSEVEPRTAITAVPITITQRGSYYLTRDLSVVSGTAITVAAANVTIDLNGFTLSTTASADRGISCSAPGLVVRDGAIADFVLAGISSTGADARVEDVLVTTTDVGGAGISLSGINSRVVGCVANGPGGATAVAGIFVGINGAIESSAASGHGVGFLASSNAVISGCRAVACGIGFDLIGNNHVSDSTALQCTDVGFDAATNCVIADSLARECGIGFQTGNGATLSGCSARQNSGRGFQLLSANVVTGCTAYLSGGDGMRVSTGSSVSGCAFYENVGSGLVLSGLGCSASSNTFRGNNAAGILVSASDCRIEGNTLTDNAIGLDVDIAGNFIARNTASGNTTANYSFTGVQTVGPVIVATGTIVSTNPWANFEF